METWTIEMLLGLLAMPAGIAAVVAWLIERSEIFQALTPRQKVITFLAGCLALPWAIAGIGIWLEMLTLTKGLSVEVFLAGAGAFYVSQLAHIPHQGKA